VNWAFEELGFLQKVVSVNHHACTVSVKWRLAKCRSTKRRLANRQDASKIKLRMLNV
jgi:hypothetical protein